MKHPNTNIRPDARTLPKPRPLPSGEVKRLASAILVKLGLEPSAYPPTVLVRIMERIQSCGVPDIDAPGFKLEEAFKNAGIAPGETLYYWGKWDGIDAFCRSDLLASAPAIWRSQSPDDAEIFDDSLEWLISIVHTGGVGWIDLSSHDAA